MPLYASNPTGELVRAIAAPLQVASIACTAGSIYFEQLTSGVQLIHGGMPPVVAKIERVGQEALP